MAAIYELAGQQDDPLAEEVLAVLSTDRPDRPTNRPDDSRRHWQWWARDPVGNSSRLWVSFAQPITDDELDSMSSRATTALQVFVPTYATTATATARQVAVDAVDLQVVLQRPRGRNLELTITLPQGGSLA